MQKLVFGTCRQCGEKTSAVELLSNDNRMAGLYCSQRHIGERRVSIPPFIDMVKLRAEMRKAKKVAGPPVIEEEEEKSDPTKDLMEESGLSKLFGF